MSNRKISLVFSLSSCIVTFKAVIVGAVFAIPFSRWLLNSFYGQANSNVVVCFLLAFIYLFFVYIYGFIVFYIYNKTLTVSSQMIDGE